MVTTRAILFAFLGVGFAAACAEGDSAQSTLAIETLTLPDAKVGEVYAVSLGGTGGKPPYRWSIASETLPLGLALEKEGALIGRPEEAGRFAFAVVLEDSESARVTGVVSLRIEPNNPGPAPTPVDRCDSPTRIILNANRALIDVQLSDRAGGHLDQACGLNATESASFLLLDVAEESRLTVSLDDDSLARVGLLDDVCPADTALTACGGSLDHDLDAGSYLLLVAGAPASMVQLDVRLEPKTPPIPMSPPTCNSPHPIDLSTGSAIISGQFADLMDGASPSCGFSAYVEAVYTIELEEPADLRITTTRFGGTKYYVRDGGCDAGRELACEDWDRPIYLPLLDAGTYHSW